MRAPLLQERTLLTSPGASGASPGAVELQGLVMHGHSIPSGFAAGSTLNYPNRVASRLRMTLTNRAASGTWMQDIAGIVASSWSVGTKGVVVAIDGNADDAYTGNGTAKSRLGFAGSLTYILALLRASVSRQASDAMFTYPTASLTWTVATEAPFGIAGKTSTLNDYVDLTWNGDSCAVVLWNVDSVSAGFNGTTYAITNTAGSTTYATGTTQDQCQLSSSGSGHPLAPTAVLLSGFGAGSHTVRIKNTSTGRLIVGGVITPTVTPPDIVVCKGVYSSTFDAPNNNANMDAINVRVDSVIASFAITDGSVVASDPQAAGFAPATMVGADGLHPNAKGDGFLADRLQAALLALPYRFGTNNVGTVAVPTPSDVAQPAASPGNLPGAGGTFSIPTVSSPVFGRFSAPTLTIADGAHVATLADQTANGRDFNCIANPNGPLFRVAGLNGKPTMDFSGGGTSDQPLAQGLLGTPIAGPFTMFIVVKCDANAVAGTDTFIDGLNSSHRYRVDVFASNPEAGSLAATGGLVHDTTAHLITVIFNGASSIIRLDRTQIAAGNAGTDPGYVGLYLAANFAATNQFIGQFSELVQYNAALSGADITTVENAIQAYYSTP